MPNPYNDPLMAQLDELYERARRSKEQGDALEQQVLAREWAEDYAQNQEPGMLDRISAALPEIGKIAQNVNPTEGPLGMLPPYLNTPWVWKMMALPQQANLGFAERGAEGALDVLQGGEAPQYEDFLADYMEPGPLRTGLGFAGEVLGDWTNLPTGGAAGLLKGLVGKGGMGLAMAAAPRLMRKGAREAAEEGAGFFSKKLPEAFDDVFEQSAKSRGGYAPDEDAIDAALNIANKYRHMTPDELYAQRAAYPELSILEPGSPTRQMFELRRAGMPKTTPQSRGAERYDDLFEAGAKSRGGYADEGIESFPAGGRAIKEQRAADEAWWKSKEGQPFKYKAWYTSLAAQNNIPGHRLVAPGTPGAEIIQVPIMRRRGGKMVEETKEIYVSPGTKAEMAKARRRMPVKLDPGPQLESANRVLAREAGETDDYIPGSLEQALRSAELYPDKSHAELYELFKRNPAIQKAFPEFRHFRPPESSRIERLNAGEVEIPETQLGNAIKFAVALPGFLAKTWKDELFDFMSSSGRTGQRKLEDRLLNSVGPREEPSIADHIMHRLVQGPRKKTYNALEQRHSQASIPPRGTPQYQALRRANAEGRLPEDYFGRKDIDPWQKNLYLALRDTPKTEIPTLASIAAIGIGGPAAVAYHAAETGPQEAYDPVTNRWEKVPEDYSGEQGRVYRDPEEVYNVGMETREDPREQYSLAGAMLKRLGEGLIGSWGLSPDDDPRVQAKKRRDRISRLETQIQLLDMTGQDTTELQEELRRMTMPNQNWMPAEQAEEKYNQAVDKGYLQSLQEIQDIKQRGWEPEYSPGWIRYVPYMNYVPALNTMVQRWYGEGEPPPLPQEPEPELFRPDAVNPRTGLPYPWVPGDNPYL